MDKAAVKRRWSVYVQRAPAPLIVCRFGRFLWSLPADVMGSTDGTDVENVGVEILYGWLTKA